MPRVVAHIQLPTDGVPDRVPSIRVVIEDVSRADAPAQVVAERLLDDVPLRGVAALDVVVEVDSVDPRQRYACRVHADLDGTGRVSSGDLLSTQSHPVLTQGAGNTTTVPLRKI